jgi:hypothetical protein
VSWYDNEWGYRSVHATEYFLRFSYLCISDVESPFSSSYFQLPCYRPGPPHAQHQLNELRHTGEPFCPGEECRELLLRINYFVPNYVSPNSWLYLVGWLSLTHFVSGLKLRIEMFSPYHLDIGWLIKIFPLLVCLMPIISYPFSTATKNFECCYMPVSWSVSLRNHQGWPLWSLVISIPVSKNYLSYLFFQRLSYVFSLCLWLWLSSARHIFAFCFTAS